MALHPTLLQIHALPVTGVVPALYLGVPTGGHSCGLTWFLVDLGIFFFEIFFFLADIFIHDVFFSHIYSFSPSYSLPPSDLPPPHSTWVLVVLCVFVCTHAVCISMDVGLLTRWTIYGGYITEENDSASPSNHLLSVVQQERWDPVMGY